MRRFWLALFVITALVHLPFGLGVWHALTLRGVPAPAGIASLVVAALVGMLRGRVRRAMSDGPLPAWRLLLVEEPYYVHWCATVASMPLFIVGALGVAARAALLGSDQLITWLGSAGLVTYGAGLVIALYGVIVRRRWVRVRTIDVPIAGLGVGFEGYRIAQLSDLHIGGLWPRRRAERWVKRVNALDVDLIALTGDYVTSGTAFHEDIAGLLSAMRGRDGAVAVMGNHDYFGDGEPLISLLRNGGVEVLRNQHKTFARGSDRITLAGVDDTWTRRADVPRTLEGRSTSYPLIALAHDPQLFPELARSGAHLVLSGHTHWGQIAMPFLATRFNLSRLSYPYHAGLYRRGASTLYVHPGLGTTGPPIRFGAPPEITVFRLRRATPAESAAGLEG